MPVISAFFIFSVLFGFKRSIAHAGMDKFELQRPSESLVERVGSLETRRVGLSRIELGGGAEFLHAHRAYGQFLTRDLGKNIETISAQHSKSIREMRRRYMFIQNLAYMRHELIHPSTTWSIMYFTKATIFPT